MFVETASMNQQTARTVTMETRTQGMDAIKTVKLSLTGNALRLQAQKALVPYNLIAEMEK